MDILVLASHSECFGLCLVEAMRAGLPVIAAKAGAIPEVVDDGETGLLYEKGDTVHLKRQLQRLVRSADLRARMGRAGRLRYEREFTAERMVRRTEAMYRTIAQSPYPTNTEGSALEAAEEERYWTSSRIANRKPQIVTARGRTSIQLKRAAHR